MGLKRAEWRRRLNPKKYLREGIVRPVILKITGLLFCDSKYGQLYYGAVHTLGQNVLGYVRKHALLKPGDRVGAAVSGGADSIAMLRILLELRQELGVVPSVVHFNHKLRGAESDTDEHFVGELARSHDLEFYFDSGDVAPHAEQHHLSLETAAREMRYAYFSRLLREKRMSQIATAHTLDDQAETVIMRLSRGAGSRGLAGIYPKLESVAGSSIVRPMLGTQRHQVESYLNDIGLGWREDASNRDLRHSRNRVRHGILPQLERDLNPAVRDALAETAELARVEEEYWDQEVNRILPGMWLDSGKDLRLNILLSLPLALQRRVIRAAAESVGLRLDFRQVAGTLEVCTGNARAVELAGGWKVARTQGVLQFARDEPFRPSVGTDYEYRISIPGKVLVPELGVRLEAALMTPDASGADPSRELLDLPSLKGDLVVRNWRSGDRFWPSHTKGPKKIKELLQERHVTGPIRQLWPVLANGAEIVWTRGFRIPSKLVPRNGAEGVLIREIEV
jgi:tRNA(Ile)-lysidine synthase